MNARHGLIVLGVVGVLTAFAAPKWLQVPVKAVSTQEKQAPSAQRIIVDHAQGKTAVPLNALRIGVFDIGALDTLDALGVDVLGVAGHAFPGHLLRFMDSKYLSLGTLFEPNYETVNSARLDLVITGQRSSSKYKQLSSITATIDMPTNDAQPVQTTLANTRLLASLFSKEERAEELAAQIQQAIQTLRAKTANRGKGLIVLVSGGKMSAYGPGSRFGALHGDFGVPPAAPNLAISMHGEAVGSEFILKTNPDWIFVIDRDAAIGETGAAKQVLDNPLVRQTTAWKQGQVVYLDPAVWYLGGGGIQALRLMIEQVDLAYGR
ncbi:MULTISPECIES: siderophore ABC transporter substrate-binding protein [Pseudomonas fluorescens group]